jgi:hypothetical protein
MTIANEYFTPAEMEAQAKFKKTSRKARKIRKKERVTADDLIGLEDSTASDLGSRFVCSVVQVVRCFKPCTCLALKIFGLRKNCVSVNWVMYAWCH